MKRYLTLCRTLVRRADASVAALQKLKVPHDEILRYVQDAKRQINQVRRCLIDGEPVPHHEKVFSIHEPHTRWISKGKAGVIAEPGLLVCVLEDQDPFILRHRILHEGVDSEMVVDFLAAARRHYPTLRS